MSSNITLSASVRSNLLSLQNTASLLDTTQTRLATGNKVNSALDNPTNYFTASALNSRASDLGNLLDGVSNAIQTIQAANDGITAIQKLVDSAKATANQAQQLAETTSGAGASTPGTVTSSSVVSPSASGSLTINGKVVSVSAAGVGTAGTVTGTQAAVATSDGTLTINGRSYTLTAGSVGSPAVSNGTATGAVGSDAASTLGFDDTSTLTLSGGGFNNVSISFDDTSGATTGASLDPSTLTVAQLITAINTQAGATIASLDTDGSLKIEGQDNATAITVGGSNTAGITTTSTAASAVAADDATSIAALINADSLATFTATVGSGVDAGKLIITGKTSTDSVNVTATVAGIGLATGNNAATPAGAADTAATLATKINGTTGIGVTATVGSGVDAGKLIITANSPNGDVDITSTVTGLGLAVANNAHVPGAPGAPNPARAALISQYNDLLDQINQLAGDANYNGNNLLVAGSSLKVLFNEAGTSNLTINGKGSDFASLGLAKLDATAGFSTNDKITGILDNLKGATDNLRANASSFGSNLSIVQMRQDFTKSIINTLQTGASNLTLADSNEEAANLLALQTRQSLSTKALSMASQSDQNVLRLLQ
jgi:flagellin-like hook-associated protein FlgL